MTALPNETDNPRRVRIVPATERLYSVAEVARLWNVTRFFLYDLMSSGRLRFVQVGPNRRRIPESALAEYVEANSVPVTR